MTFRKLRCVEGDLAIGQNLRRIRRSQSLTQSDLAAMIDVRTQQIHKYEAGKNSLSVNAMKLIAGVLGVSPCEICGCCEDQ